MTETFHNGRYNPCRGCPDRYPACSGHCEKPEFLKYKEKQELIRKNRAAYTSPQWAQPEINPNAYRGHKRR